MAPWSWEASHWKSTDDGYWVKELLFIHLGGLDLGYLRRRSKEEGTREALEDFLVEVKGIGNEKH